MEAAAAGIPDEALLEAADRVEEIRRGRGSFDGSVHDLPERQGELREMEASLSTSLGGLGRQWGATDLEDFDTSLVVRNWVDAWKERLTGSGDRLRQAGLRLEQERRTLLDRQLETQEAREQLPPEPPGPAQCPGLRHRVPSRCFAAAPATGADSALPGRRRAGGGRGAPWWRWASHERCRRAGPDSSCRCPVVSGQDRSFQHRLTGNVTSGPAGSRRRFGGGKVPAGADRGSGACRDPAGQIDGAALDSAEARRMGGRVAAIEKDIQEFRQKVETLAVAHDIALADGNWGQLASAADALINRMERAREAQSHREAALEQTEGARRVVEDRERRQGQAQQELDDFLNQYQGEMCISGS